METGILDFPELSDLRAGIAKLGARARTRVECTVSWRGLDFPLYSIAIGSEDPKAPVLGIFGGLHGNERIGSHVALAALHLYAERLTWDESLRRKLETTRVILMPMVNPIGVFRGTRANENGVDLNRNCPVEAEQGGPPVLCGHRYGPWLAHYRGPEGAPLEPEVQAVVDFVRREAFQSEFSILIDLHSGYGMHDRIWFPYAKTSRPFPELAEVWALKELFDRTYPHNIYLIEPQSLHYSTHGDLWDYAYELHHASGDSGVMLPFALEMGSWRWVKKNPIQAFSRHGLMNPVKPHRFSRTIRRHLVFLDFLHRVVESHRNWRPLTAESKAAAQARIPPEWHPGDVVRPVAASTP